MVRRGLEDMDELEEAERREAEAPMTVPSAEDSLPLLSDMDWEAILRDLGPAAVPGTAAEVSGSSQGG